MPLLRAQVLKYIVLESSVLYLPDALFFFLLFFVKNKINKRRNLIVVQQKVLLAFSCFFENFQHFFSFLLTFLFESFCFTDITQIRKFAYRHTSKYNHINMFKQHIPIHAKKLRPCYVEVKKK